MTNFFGSKNKNKNPSQTNLFGIKDEDYCLPDKEIGAELIRIEGDKLTIRVWDGNGEVLITTTPLGKKMGVVVSIIQTACSCSDIPAGKMATANYSGVINWISIDDFTEDKEEVQ